MVLIKKYKRRKNKGGQNNRNEEDGNDRGKKTPEKVYGLHSDKELNWDLGTEYHKNDSDNDNKEHIPRVKGWPIKKKKDNKPYPPTVKETFLKATHNK